jgi:hypothetical protein
MMRLKEFEWTRQWNVLCSIHSQRTLQRKLGKSPAYDQMAALCFRRSEAGCKSVDALRTSWKSNGSKSDCGGRHTNDLKFLRRSVRRAHELDPREARAERRSANTYPEDNIQR